MRNPIFEKITQAIDEHRLLLITDEAGPRLLEPYLIFESPRGDMLLHGWQQAGAFRRTPPPHWCNLHLEDIHTAQVLAEQFPKPHRDYNPRRSEFHRILYEIDVGRTTLVEPSLPLPHPRVKPARRRPPGGQHDRASRHNSRWDFRG